MGSDFNRVFFFFFWVGVVWQSYRAKSKRVATCTCDYWLEFCARFDNEGTVLFQANEGLTACRRFCTGWLGCSADVA